MNKLSRHYLIELLLIIILWLVFQRYLNNAWQRNIIYVDMFRRSQIGDVGSSSQMFSSKIEESADVTMTMLASVDQFSKVLHRFPDDQSTVYGLAYTASKTNQYETASMAFNLLEGGRAGVLFPLKVLAFSKTGILNELDSENRAAMAEQLARFGRQYLVTGRREEALKMYELATEVYEGNFEFWLDRIEIYANEWDKALNAYEYASILFPDNPYMLIAGAYIKMNYLGNYIEGAKLLDRATLMVENVDISSLSRTQLAWLYYGYVMNANAAIREGNIAQARDWLKQAINLPSNSIAPYTAQERLNALESGR